MKSIARSFRTAYGTWRAPLLGFLIVLIASPVFAQQRKPKFDPEKERERMERLHRESSADPDEESKEDVKGREEWFYHRRSFPYDVVPAGARAQAIRETKLMESRMRETMAKKGAEGLAANKWTEIGPFNVGGRIRAIAVHPRKPEILYIGAAAGGVWKTTDGGDSWSSTFDQQSSLAMGALAIDPNHPDTIYAGTGEDTPHPMAYLGDGIFRSTNGGATWQHMGMSQVGAFSKMHVHNQNPNIVYASATRSSGGFYRSTDYGATWTQTFKDDAYDMSVNPRQPNNIFISTVNGIYRSYDGGLTFVRKSTGFDGTNGNRVSVALAPTDSSRVYALISRLGGQSGNNLAAIYKSTNGGESWTLSRSFGESFFRAQGNYNNALSVHPTNPNWVYALGIDVYRTTNGGNNWINVTNVYPGPFNFEVAHPDQHTIAYDPTEPDITYLGSDGGLYRSADAGTNWMRIGTRLPITQFYAMDIDPTEPKRTFGGTQDNGTVGTVTGSLSNWIEISGGDGFWVATDLDQPNYVYSEIYYGQAIYRVNVATRQMEFLNTEELQSDPGDWSTPLAVSPADGISLYSGRRNLWRSLDKGDSWERLAVPGGNVMSTIALSPHNAEHIVVGKGSGGVYHSENGGETWGGATGLPLKYVTDMIVDPKKPERVYVTFSGFGDKHVYRSDDFGASFVDITSNLPDIPVSAIEVDPDNNSHIFVGSDAGVFVTLDGGGLWLPFNDGLAYSPVTDLKIHASDRTLRAATFGRSMFSIGIDNPQPQPLIVEPTGGETYQTPTSLDIRWAGFTSRVRILISYDGGNSYDTLAHSVEGSSVIINLPLIKSPSVRVKIEEIETGKSVVSGNFTLTPAVNGQEVNTRGAVAEALATRGNQVWVTSRNSETIYRLRLPGFLSKQEVTRSGITGTIRDLAYDAGRDIFYALVTKDDFSEAKLYRMDTNAAATGEIDLPATVVSGIEMTPQGLAVITPGVNGTLYTINPEDGSVISANGALNNAVGEGRHGLSWDGQGLVQAIDKVDGTSEYASQLQLIQVAEPPRVVSGSPVISSTASAFEFFGITFDNVNSDGAKRIFYVSDTSGSLYRITVPFVSDAPGGPGRLSSNRSMEIVTVSPNPFRDQGHILYRLRNADHVTFELWQADGTRAAVLFNGAQEAGEHRLDFETTGLSSGIYYIALSGGGGERVVMPVVVMK